MKKNIWVEENFQTSINIEFDLHDEEKIKKFIPTISSIEVIENILLSTSKGAKNRAKILIGAYGRGKSHIVLVTLALLLNKKRSLFKTLLSKLKVINNDLYDYTNEYLQSNDKLLPVIINGSNQSLVQSFIYSLQKTLKNEGLSDIIPETNFSSAVSTIENWKNDYPDTFKKFKKEISIQVSTFINKLKEFDVDIYSEFTEIYPKLTSGGEFNPFSNVNVIELYESVANKIGEYGYKGLYVVYDEFSKYLESNISSANKYDTKLLQDFAEKCNRTGEYNQLHLMLISHKDISNYINSKISKNRADAWLGVSGRFENINFQSNFTQMYEIISFVIKKDKIYWNEFVKRNKEQLTNLKNTYTQNSLFKADDNIFIEKCYPLHPSTTFILPRLSEKVAQNERTMFTFLSSNEKHTLSRFISNSKKINMLTPDYLFDYFETSFRRSDYTTEYYKIYKLALNILNNNQLDELSCKLIKTIALFYMVESFDVLPPLQEYIIDIYVDNKNDFNKVSKSLRNLIEKNFIIYQKRSNGYLKLKENFELNIKNEIQLVINRDSSTLSVEQVLNNSYFDSFLYPTAYNDDMGLIRYFDFKFISSKTSDNLDYFENIINDSNSVGTVFAVIPENYDAIKTFRNKIAKKCSNNRMIFVLPKDFVDIENIVYEYYAINKLKETQFDDVAFLNELDLISEDLDEYIDRFIKDYIKPELGKMQYYCKTKFCDFKRKAQLTKKLCDISYELYPNTPIIINETINKDNITTQALNSRTKVLNALLETNLKYDLGLVGTGQDVSFMRSVLIRTNILINNEKENNASINLSTNDNNLNNVLLEITTFFQDASKSTTLSFSQLYEVLTNTTKGYGIKKGLIPFFIASALNSFKDYTIIKYKDEEVSLTGSLLNSINENPDKYTVYIENWNNDKTIYIEKLCDIFDEYLIKQDVNTNSFSHIVVGMKSWYMNLSKYTKESKTIYVSNEKKDIAIEKSKLKFISSFKTTNLKTRDFLFDNLFNTFEYSDFTLDILKNIEETKTFFDEIEEELIKSLINDIKSVFATKSNIKTSLSNIIKDYVENLKEETLSYLFINNENKVLSLMQTIGNDDVDFVRKLAHLVTSLRIEDWNRNTIDNFNNYLKQAKKTIDYFDKNKAKNKSNINTTNSYTISFVDTDGNKVSKSFEKTDYSKRATLLFNDISSSIEEMGHSISEIEKRQILMDLLEKLC